MRSGGRKGGVPQGRRLPYPIVSRTRRPVLSRRASYPAKVDRLSYTGKGRASLPCQRRLAILARDQYTATLPELTGHSIWAAIARCYAAFAAPLRGSPRAEKSRLPCQEELGYPVEVIGRQSGVWPLPILGARYPHDRCLETQRFGFWYPKIEGW